MASVSGHPFQETAPLAKGLFAMMESIVIAGKAKQFHIRHGVVVRSAVAGDCLVGLRALLLENPSPGGPWGCANAQACVIWQRRSQHKAAGTAARTAGVLPALSPLSLLSRYCRRILSGGVSFLASRSVRYDTCGQERHCLEPPLANPAGFGKPGSIPMANSFPAENTTWVMRWLNSTALRRCGDVTITERKRV